MLLRTQLVSWYIFSCLRIATPPWKYFQLNAPYFNADKGIFSKLEMDQRIPAHWQLKQYLLSSEQLPTTFPVFVKPDWGQNGHGIFRADDKQAYQQLQEKLSRHAVTYLVQEAAQEPREFEIFYIREQNSAHQFAILTATEVIHKGDELWPINSVLNSNTQYQDITHRLSKQNKQQLWSSVNQLGHYRIARVGVRANTLQEMLDGHFHIIEINLFIPLPLRLLDNNLSTKLKRLFIQKSMRALAQTTKAIPNEQQNKSIFFNKLISHYKVKNA